MGANIPQFTLPTISQWIPGLVRNGSHRTRGSATPVASHSQSDSDSDGDIPDEATGHRAGTGDGAGLWAPVQGGPQMTPRQRRRMKKMAQEAKQAVATSKQLWDDIPDSPRSAACVMAAREEAADLHRGQASRRRQQLKKLRAVRKAQAIRSKAVPQQRAALHDMFVGEGAVNAAAATRTPVHKRVASGRVLGILLLGFWDPLTLMP